MLKPENWEETQASEEGKEVRRIEPGGYICTIKGVQDVPEKQYLRIMVDVDQGKFAGIFMEQYREWGGKYPFAGTIIRSYKPKALGMFKWFIKCVEQSNSGYHYAFDENTLKGKKIGLVFREEEYLSKDGDVKTSVRCDYVTTIQNIVNGSFTVKDKKPLSAKDKERMNSMGSTEPAKQDDSFVINDDDLQF